MNTSVDDDLNGKNVVINKNEEKNESKREI
jgi:hypothetical protein